jgi:transposase-like protein
LGCSRNCVRKQWRCRDCGHTFSVTSGTIFAFHKLPLKVYLAAIAIYTNAVKGLSALQLGRDLGVQYKTAFVLAHKIRESLMEQREFGQLDGEVHMDGAYVNGHIRPKNKKADRIEPNAACLSCGRSARKWSGQGRRSLLSSRTRTKPM